MSKRILFGAAGCLAVALAIVACNTGGLNITPSGSSSAGPDMSPGRQNALRNINVVPGNLLHFELRQQDPMDPMQTRCDPLGLNGGTPWTLLAAKDFTPDKFNINSQYDYISTVLAETDIVLGLRVPVEPSFPLNFSQVEFSLRAVNPVANGHVHAVDVDYLLTQADFPSNADGPETRSLISLGGGDVALVVIGIDFVGDPMSTTGTMNFLGPTGWLVFMRDNAFRSGRFFTLRGSRRGAPPAFFDTGDPMNFGAFESVQVDGDSFDALSEPVANTTPFIDANDPMTGDDGALVCAGAPTPLRFYRFIDLSNLEFDPMGVAGDGSDIDSAPGKGGGLFVIRSEAFISGQVVVNPNIPPVPGGPPGALEDWGSTIPAPGSGYDETVIPGITANGIYDEDNHAPGGVPDGPAGVHEIGWSIFFVHG